MFFKIKQAGKFSCIICLFGIIVFSSCNQSKNKQVQQTTAENITKGKLLAAKYCQSCHLLPSPDLLDAATWQNGVLPGMGPRLGIYFYGDKEYPSYRYDKNLDTNYYPSQRLVSFQEWQCIIDYYTSSAPDTLPAQKRIHAVKSNASLFKIEKFYLNNKTPSTCMVKIDTTVFPRQLLVADMLDKNIYRYNSHIVLTDSFKSTGPITDVEIHGQHIVACNTGNINPNNGRYGSVEGIHMDVKNKMYADSSLHIDQLARPVQIAAADFNADGKTDYLVCEYGNLTGALSWMENHGNDTYQRHVIRAAPGAIKAYTQDVNKDGLPDVWALFAQGDEGIFLFTNKGNGKFEQEQLLRFPAIYGSSYFELADFNKDGYPDIVYTCGDNADYSNVLKPYHGIYIFINDGKNRFNQQYFFPMHGCFKAMARDFDGDGDLDIAAISFFSDYVLHPEESFVYLENKGRLDFQPYTFPGTAIGRWLTMDVGDMDADGKEDIILGNFSVQPLSVKAAAGWKTGPSFIMLKNVMKK